MRLPTGENYKCHLSAVKLGLAWSLILRIYPGCFDLGGQAAGLLQQQQHVGVLAQLCLAVSFISQGEFLL